MKKISYSDYYFWIVVATPKYLENIERVRLLNGVDYDSFYKVPDTEVFQNKEYVKDIDIQ